MSLVVFPFKDEALDVVAANLNTAGRHERVTEVWAVAAAEDAAMAAVARVADEASSATGTPVHVFAQNRLGGLRPGKGDGMNTAIAMSADRGFDRTHFYDADITNFEASWIDGAEFWSDRGYGVVRHRFPRAATDAMITWMVTRPGFAKLFPGTLLPRLGQPLGGELLLSGSVVAELAADSFVRHRSDWGIDTVLTHATSVLDTGIYEHNVVDGKRHALYGSLTDIRDMVLECLDAVASLTTRPTPPAGKTFDADPPAGVPADLKETVAYDLDSTRAAIAEPPSPSERVILDSMGVDADADNEIDAERWGSILDHFLGHFRLGDPDWESAAFRLWVQRVISYTTSEVVHGYDQATSYLERTITHYERAGLG